MKRKASLWIGGILAGIVVAIAAPILIAHIASSPGLRTLDGQQIVPAIRPVSDESHIVVIGRRPERMHIADPVDHRNSRIAIYQRSEDGWDMVRGPLPTRSHSTLEGPPQFQTPDEAMTRRSGQFGYHSVPLGIFSLVEIPWRNENRAFLISDHGRTDGTISLRRPQEIRSYTVALDESEEPGFRLEIAEDAVRSTWDKRDSALHPTHTSIWSHGDSRGCINLFQPNVPAGHPDREGSPWQTFLGWLDEFGMTGGGKTFVLVLLPWEEVSDPSGESMADVLPLDFHKSLVKHEGGA